MSLWVDTYCIDLFIYQLADEFCLQLGMTFILFLMIKMAIGATALAVDKDILDKFLNALDDSLGSEIADRDKFPDICVCLIMIF
jgi:hypothetical protein